MPFLYRVHADGSASSRHPLRHEPLIVGRSSPACVQIPDDVALSHEHFALIPSAGGILLRDLGSTNGTWVNGRRVHERLLLPHDRIRAGQSHFALEPGLATMINELSDLVIRSE